MALHKLKEELQGFDEYMNLVIDEAVEVKLATNKAEESRRQLGERSVSKPEQCTDLFRRPDTP